MPTSGTLTKAHIIDAVAEINGFTGKKATETVEILLELIKKSLESGEDVLLSGFGKFCVKNKKKRKGRNPATGEDLILAPRKVVTFHSSMNLRGKLNSKKAAVNKEHTKKIAFGEPIFINKVDQMAPKRQRLRTKNTR
jgi:integration host factor subunit alpha